MPNEPHVTRKLSAIFSADVKGYSLLMSDDEVHTIATLKAYRQIMSETIQQHSGRVVDTPGDNLLAEFKSAVDAVQCAVDVQQRLGKENARYVEEKRLEFRIGVNIGDVVQEGDRIYGSGVNVAARIEGLADPGGVCISRNVYNHIKDKLGFGYQFIGSYDLKNIKEPVRVYKVFADPTASQLATAKEQKKPSLIWSIRGVVALIIIGSSFFAWQFYIRQSSSLDNKKIDPAALSSPKKPSIAVLPFDNLSDDHEQEYFSDGITDDIITNLSKIKNLMVISRNSTFTFKGKSQKIPDIARELKVRYVLEGSVRRSGDNVRVVAQLIDAQTDHHVWAERFDGQLDNVFELQDLIAGKIVNALAIKLTSEEQSSLIDKGTDNIEAYDAFLKGKNHLSLNTASGHTQAISNFKTAINIDPNYSKAYAALGIAYQSGSNFGFLWQMGLDYREARLQAQHYMELAMNRPTYEAYQLSGTIAMHRRQFKKAIDQFEEALSMASNDIYSYVGLGWALIANGRSEAAVEYLDKGLQVDPLNIRSSGTIKCLTGMAYFCMKKYEQCIASIEKAQKQYQELNRFSCFVAAAYALLDRDVEAAKALDNYLKKVPPNMQLIYYSWPFKNRAVFDRLKEGLVKAGFPGEASDYFEVTEDNMLSSNEIKDLIHGHTVIGDFWGGEWMHRYSKDGKIFIQQTYNSEIGKEWYDETVFNRNETRSTSSEGTAWVKDDMNCWQSEDHFNGLKKCEHLYRNPKGNRAAKSDYIGLDEMGIYLFSVID